VLRFFAPADFFLAGGAIGRSTALAAVICAVGLRRLDV
jgi:hypothetical protein